MRLLPRLIGFVLLSLLTGLLLLTSSCETSRRTREYSDPLGGAVGGEPDGAEAGARRIVEINETGALEYRTPQAQLAAAFIRQFGDGMVIDKVSVRKAPSDNPKVKGQYYLIGLGLKNGNFRAMALPLATSSDGSTLYLSPEAECYVLTGEGCPACYFDFEGNRIVGTSCGENYGGSHCDLRIVPSNTLFVRPKKPAPAPKIPDETISRQ